MASSSMLHVRIDDALKASAAEKLSRMGISTSDAVRMLLRRVVDDQSLPAALLMAPHASGVREERISFGSAIDYVIPRKEIDELNVVRLLAEVATEDGGKLPAGSLGTVVYRYASGRDYEVEFSEPEPMVLTLRADEIDVTWRG